MALTKEVLIFFLDGGLNVDEDRLVGVGEDAVDAEDGQAEDDEEPGNGCGPAILRLQLFQGFLVDGQQLLDGL